jgi:receptor protein-tyrosine kinase
MKLDLIAASVEPPARAAEPLGLALGIEPQDIERVLATQREKGLRFGEAARALGLATQADIDLALARQFGLPCIEPGASGLSVELIAAYEPAGPQAEALRAVRDQLILRWLERKPESRALAILSAASGEGRSFIAANLAIVFSQLGSRTLLIDADLRNPRQHRLFGLENRIGLSALLSGRAAPHEALSSIAELPNLSVLPAGATPPNPQDLLARPAFAQLLRQLGAQSDVVLIDCPPAGASTDAQTIAVRAGAALVVVRRHSSRLWRVQGISASVGEAQARIVGAVLNER